VFIYSVTLSSNVVHFFSQKWKFFLRRFVVFSIGFQALIESLQVGFIVVQTKPMMHFYHDVCIISHCAR